MRVPAPLDCLPLFIRSGSVIPFAPPSNRIPEDSIEHIILNVYPDLTIQSYLYEDEGVTDFSGSMVNNRLQLAWRGTFERQFAIRVVGVQRPSQVSGTSVLSWGVIEDNVVEIKLDRQKDGQIELY
jgi:alpha-glucosidase (family GH31 glycosyl hydrolase)